MELKTISHNYEKRYHNYEILAPILFYFFHAVHAMHAMCLRTSVMAFRIHQVETPRVHCSTQSYATATSKISAEFGNSPIDGLLDATRDSCVEWRCNSPIFLAISELRNTAR